MNTDPNLTPIEEADAKKRTLILAMSGVIVFSIFVLFTLAFFWFQPAQNGLLAKYFPSPTATRRPVNTPVPTRTLVPDLTATQSTWTKSGQSPTLGSVEETQNALEAGMNYLEGFAFVVPDTPEINQPGDIYVYEIQLDQSESVIWSYGWCTTSQTILTENFTHMQVVFIINEAPTAPDHFLIQDEISDDGSACREYTTTLNSWPNGQHQLEVRVTFTSPTDDGWNLYPAGTHTFKYMVSVN